MLRVTGLTVHYAGAIDAVNGLSLDVQEGHIVALLGANGAGKSTTLKAISGLLKSDGGQITGGHVEFDAQPLGQLDAGDIVRLGVFQVMEGRRVFKHLSVEDNLRTGAHTRQRKTLGDDLQQVYEYFPRLRERRRGHAGYLSGGEQQMLAIGRALMARPRLIMLDEPSLGLAPLVVLEIFDIIQRVNRESGTSFLLVEQNANIALKVASHAYVMANGRIVLQGMTATLRDNSDVRNAYLGLSEYGTRRGYGEAVDRQRWAA